MVIFGAGSRRLQGSLSTSLPVFLTAGLLAVALAGCTSAESAPVRHGTAGTLEGSVQAADDSWAAKLSSSDKMLHVTTHGSSTCPSFVTSVTLADGDHLTVTAEVEDANAVCTADLMPWTSSIAVPESVFANPTVRVTLAGNPEDINLEVAK